MSSKRNAVVQKISLKNVKAAPKIVAKPKITAKPTATPKVSQPVVKRGALNSQLTKNNTNVGGIGAQEQPKAKGAPVKSAGLLAMKAKLGGKGESKGKGVSSNNLESEIAGAKRNGQDQSGKGQSGKGGKDGLNKRQKTAKNRKFLDDGQPWYGCVHSWNPERGFGWVVGDDAVDPSVISEAAMNQGKIFVARGDLGGVALRDLYPGMRVQYTLYSDERGLGGCKVMPEGMSDGGNDQMCGMLQGLGQGQLKKLKEGDIVVRIRVASSLVPLLIGKGGEGVKDMKKKTGASFDFSEWKEVGQPSEENPPSGEKNSHNLAGNHVINIMGDPGQVAQGLLKIAEITQQASLALFQRLLLVIPNTLIGKVIGKKGENIKKLKGDNPYFRIHIQQDPVALAMDAGEEQVTLMTFFGPSESMITSVAAVVDFLSDEFTRDFEQLQYVEQQSMGMGMSGMGMGGMGMSNADMGYDDMGYDHMGYDNMGYDNMGYDNYGCMGMGYDDYGYGHGESTMDGGMSMGGMSRGMGGMGGRMGSRLGGGMGSRMTEGLANKLSSMIGGIGGGSGMGSKMAYGGAMGGGSGSKGSLSGGGSGSTAGTILAGGLRNKTSNMMGRVSMNDKPSSTGTRFGGTGGLSGGMGSGKYTSKMSLKTSTLTIKRR